MFIQAERKRVKAVFEQKHRFHFLSPPYLFMCRLFFKPQNSKACPKLNKKKKPKK
jgi:hypothetical protein